MPSFNDLLIDLGDSEVDEFEIAERKQEIDDLIKDAIYEEDEEDEDDEDESV